jgi:hypothetical protein
MHPDKAQEKVEQAIDRLAKAAAHDIANGADTAEVARQLAEIVEPLSEEEKMQHLLTVAEGMTKEEIQQVIAALEAIDESDEAGDDDEGGSEGETGEEEVTPPPSAKSKKPKKRNR